MNFNKTNTQHEWPIYTLVDYDNSGRLLDLCRGILYAPDSSSPDSNNEEQKQCTTTTTSGYHTTLEEAATSQQPKQSKGSLHSQAKGQPSWNQASLAWWQLIESRSPTVNYANEDPGPRPERELELERKFRARLAKLRHEIERAVCPFVSRLEGEASEPGRLAGSSTMVEEPSSSNSASRQRRADKQPSQRHWSELNPSHLKASSQDDNSALRLKRLSWRRRRRLSQVGPQPPLEQQQGREQYMAKTHTLGRLVRKETFSLGSWRKVLTSDGDSRGSMTLLDRCLGRRLARDRRTQAFIWSQEPRFRGKYGESLVHLLLINHSNEHLILLVLVLRIWPELLLDTFQSDKFKHLNCLHLTIAYGRDSTRLLEYLLGLARTMRPHEHALRQLVEQKCTGSLFRSPLVDSVNTKKRKLEETKFWCDSLEHWPSANGSQHLILFDRIQRLASSRSNQTAALEEEEEDSERGGPGNRRQQIYFGQTPLAWAASFESRDMFELLVSEGRAQVPASDCEGNNCLHLLVINGQPNWSRFLFKFDSRLGQAENFLGLTPFLLACHLGRVQLFEELLELSAVEFWTYSSVKCCAYPLTSLDSIVMPSEDSASGASQRQKQRQQRKSAVAVILESSESSDEQKSLLLSTGVIKKLLEEKWRGFARHLFYSELILTLLQLLVTYFACLIRPARIQLDYGRELELHNSKASVHIWSLERIEQFLQERGKLNLLRNACELFIVVVSATRLWSFLVEWFRYRSLSLQFTYNPLVTNLVLANLLIVSCLPLRLAGFLLRHSSKVESRELLASRLLQLDQLEDFLLILASPLLWSSLLFFVAAFYVTGPFVAMINYMLMRDLRQFSLIYLIFLHSFAQSIFFANYDQAEAERLQELREFQRGSTVEEEQTLGPLASWLTSIGAQYAKLWLELFKMTLGVYELQPFRRSLMSRSLLLLFLYLISILFNMLIAMMNNTYSLVISQSERAWSFQWARTLFALERRLSEGDKLLYLKKYSINMTSSIRAPKSKDEDANSWGANVEKETEEGQQEQQFVPGLMIIKQTNCTRAELRRRIVGHWQKSTRRVLDALKCDAAGATC